MAKVSLALCVALASSVGSACSSTAPDAGAPGDVPFGSSTPDSADPARATGPAATGALDPDPAAGPESDTGSTQKLVCPGCRPAGGGQTSDFGDAIIEEPCPVPERELAAELEARFRVDEVRQTVERTFSQPLGWGRIADDGRGLDGMPASTTTIDGTIELGEFRYHECHDSAKADVTMHIRSRDGALDTMAHGELEYRNDDLGWPADSGPALYVFAKDDLTSARGTLDLQLDPNVVQGAELAVGLMISRQDVKGWLRVQVMDYASVADRAADQVVTDTPTARAIHEPVAAVFPIDTCLGAGFAADLASPRPALGGESWGEVFEGLWSRFGAPMEVDGVWEHGGQTRVTLELGELPAAAACEGLFTLDFTANTRVSSADGRLDVPLTLGMLSVAPYSSRAQNAQFDVGDGASWAVLSPNDDQAASGGVVEWDGDRFIDMLQFPACAVMQTACPSDTR